MGASIQHIDSVPERCGGKPCIVGTRIRVYDVYVWHVQSGKTVDEIVHDFPQLSHADVYAALMYYHDHREEITAQMKADEEFAAELKAKQAPTKLERHLQGEISRDAIPPG